MLYFPGLVLPFNQHHLLVYGPDAEALGTPLFGPPVYLRPGYWLLTRQEYLLPTAVIDDYGQRLDAPECYEWIEARGDAFPRADVIGLLPSGETQSVFMKELDLAVMAAFAAPAERISNLPNAGQAGNLSYTRVDLAIEALAVPDGYAVAPTPLPPPIQLLARALPGYRLAPGVFGAVGAAILNRLLAVHPSRADWRLTFDEIDDTAFN